MNITEIVSAAISVAGALVALYAARFNRRKPWADDASAASAMTEAATKLIAPLNHQIAGLQAQITTLNATVGRQAEELTGQQKQLSTQGNLISEMRAGIRLLNTQIVSLGQKPLYTLPLEPEEPRT